MGEVYRAYDPTMHREVAIKVLPPTLSADRERLVRFEQEAQAAGALNHPNILIIHYIDTHDGAPYIVSELLEGGTLRERMGGAAMSPRKAIDFALQIAHGLAAAHEKGIVHRDLKPENVFITKDGRVKILDFGLAKLAATGDGAQPQTEIPTRRVDTDPGVVMGTIGYMSPEQVRGKPADHRSDIFSFGAILYEMLSGRRAFRGESTADTISAILREDPPDLSTTNRGVNPALERIVNHCLEKNPEERFNSARDLAFALEALSGGGDSASTRAVDVAETTSQVATRRTSWSYLGWIAAAVLLALTLVFGALYFRRATPRAETIRFQLLAPEKTTFAESLALSPDGRKLAYVARGSSGRTLWMRSLDSIDARELEGTEGAEFPFWSPDSRYLGFFAANKLKKIDSTGGRPQILAEASADPRGAAWGTDGTILFAPNFTTQLFKVPASGGAVEAATQFDQSREDTSHRWPAFLPDGRHFLYFARSKKRELEGIFVGSLDSKHVRFLFNSNLLAAYTPTSDGKAGYLLLMRESALMAQPFEPNRLELSGEPFIVAEGVLNFPKEGGPTGYAAFSVSGNGHLSYLSGDAAQTQAGWYDREGKSLGSIGPEGQFSEPCQSPDGKRVAWARSDAAMSSDIWLLDVWRGTLTRFTFDAAADVSPVWSQDGTRIFYASNRDGGRFGIYERISSGAGRDELLLKTNDNSFPDSSVVTREGEFLLFESENSKFRFDLWVLPLTGGERKPIAFMQTEFNETHAQFSPDGRFIAYVSDESGRAEVYVATFPAAGGKWQISTNGGDQPQWRRDGKEIFYVAPDKTLMAVPVTAGNSFEVESPVTLFATRIATGGLTGDRNRYVVAADGQRFLVSNVLDEEAKPLTVVLNWNAGPKR